MSSLEVDNAWRYDGPVNRCNDDGDCATGACDLDESICIAQPAVDALLLARVLTGGRDGTGPQRIEVPMETSEDLLLTVRARVRTSSIEPAMVGRVVFLDLDNALPGREPGIEVYNAGATASDFHLLPGRYEVTLVPDGDDAALYPVLSKGEILVDTNGAFLDGDGVPADLRMPHAEEDFSYVPFSGYLIHRQNSGETFSANDFSVVARDAATSRVVSSTVRSGCRPEGECGWFELTLAPGVRSMRIDVFKEREPFHPVYHFDVNDVTRTGETYEIPLPALPVMVEGSVQVQSESAMPPPPPRTRIRMTLQDDTGHASLSYDVYTNDNGQVERQNGYPGIYLYPGLYAVTAIPVAALDGSPSTCSAARLEALLEVTVAGSAPFVVMLPSRLSITGTIAAPGSPGPTVPMATIETFDLENSQGGLNRLSALSGREGTFAIWLDNSLYHAVARAPLESGWAAGTGVWNIRQSETFTYAIRLTVPFRIRGHLELEPGVGGDPDDLRDLSVEWYRVFSQVAYLVGRSTVATDGSFTALLPPQ